MCPCTLWLFFNEIIYLGILSMKRILTILVLFFGVLQLSAQVSVSAVLDSTSVMIGDHVDITLHITSGPEVSLEEVDISALDTLSEIELLKIGDLSQVSKSKSGHLFEQKITITSFTEGIYQIPQIRLPFSKNGQQRNVFTNTLQLKVNTFDVTEATELQPIKNIIDEPVTFRDYLPFILGGLGIVALGFLTWYLIKRLRKKETFGEFEKKKLPAHIIALKKLDTLNAAELWQKGEIKLFQSQLTFIFREYLEDRFKIPALESTTDEIVKALKSTDIDEAKTASLKKILQTADLVKFAKSEPPVSVHNEAFQNILAFVNETIPVIKEEEEEETASNPSQDTGDATND